MIEKNPQVKFLLKPELNNGNEDLINQNETGLAFFNKTKGKPGRAP